MSKLAYRGIYLLGIFIALAGCATLAVIMLGAMQ